MEETVEELLKRAKENNREVLKVSVKEWKSTKALWGHQWA
jgi:hypothetical protein